jgi:hypothetical protein
MSSTVEAHTESVAVARPSNQIDRVGRIQSDLYGDTCTFAEGAEAIGKSPRTVYRLVVALGVTIYRYGNVSRFSPTEMREKLQACAERRQHAMAPRAVGRPPAGSNAAPVRTAGRATKPVHEARGTARK